MTDAKLRIVSAALNFDGLILSMPAPARHSDLIRAVDEYCLCLSVRQENQGFLDAGGHFLTREEALKRAYETGQLDKSDHPRHLFSEDLW